MDRSYHREVEDIRYTPWRMKLKNTKGRSLTLRLYSRDETEQKIFNKERLTSSSRASPVKYRTACSDKYIKHFINNLLLI